MKVKYLPYQPHCFAFGGFEIQMLSTLKAVQSIGVDASQIDPWSRDNNFNIMHCWGLGVLHSDTIYWAKKNNKKVVVTALLGYYETLNEKFRFYSSSLIYKQRIIREMLDYIDKVVVVNEKQADVCTKMYKLNSSIVHIIPHVVDDVFFSSANIKEKYEPHNPYILIVGNICKRKNQVMLTQACIEENIPLIIIGKSLDGEEDYKVKLEKLIAKSSKVKWIHGLSENSNELLAYYKNCFAVALPSLVEQQPISLLEGGVLNKPLIVSNKAYGLQKYYKNASLVNPESIESIKLGIRKVIKNRDDFKPDPTALKQCSGSNVAAAYNNVYKML